MMYRNKKLLELANAIPTCTGCGAFNVDNIVAAHSNQLRDGKGRGIKSHDFRIAYLCSTCHYTIDQGPTLSREERLEFFEEAMRKTHDWLWLNGHLKVV
jgi:hypothetical protein